MAEKAVFTVPELVGDKLYLRPATAENVANTYHWYLASDPTMLIAEDAPIMAAAEASEAYKRQAAEGDGQRFVAVSRKGNEIVGWIRYYQVNQRNRSARLEFIVDPDHRKKGHAVRAIRLLCRYLFQSVGLNKVSVTVCALNSAAVNMLESAGFKKDGTLRHEYFYDGEFREGYIYSLLRFEFGL